MSPVRITALLLALALAPLAWAQQAPPPPALKNAPRPATAAAPAATAATAGVAAPGTQPDLTDLLPTRIEQIKRGNRVSEVRVTGINGEARYSMDNREGRSPSPAQSFGSGLSTPNFLKIEF